MKKSLCLETVFTEESFERRFELAAQAGFDHVEFWTWQDKDIEKIKYLSDKHNLTIASFSGDHEFSLVNRNESSEYIQFVEESIKRAHVLQCEHLVIHSNALGEEGRVLNRYEDISDFAKFATIYDTLKNLAPIAERAKVTLCLEPLNIHVDHAGNFLAYSRDSADLIQLVNSPYIKMLFDVYHMQINEGNLIGNIEKYVKQISYFHIADAPGRHEPGTGEIHFKNIMNTLRKLEYKGVIGFELYPSNNSIEILRDLLCL
ncbi:TIM barrel protein [Paenibacillus alginolyticus]|uniref:TIM barrel protein n=1 Tax=Paenibacillus alginolyticus TaxID=59839 RepID=UPI0004184135|nr:TIM barrel protein [Paenibacillus alginolyticus]MCY9665807.1 TIM barrel protein [Paenibacillus alginolyticus]